MKLILKPWEELTEKQKDWWFDSGEYSDYEHFVKGCTRPLTSDDLRGMLRMPDEWTEEEYQEHRKVCFEGNSISASVKAIDIALRAAPEHKPCPFCGQRGIAFGQEKETRRYHIRCSDCDCRTPGFYTREDAWAAWDKRSDK